MSERAVEVPFVVKWAKGPDILDVGKDQGHSYSIEFENMGFNVEACDVDPVVSPTYLGKFQEVDIPRKYDTIVFLSSLEHFNGDIDSPSIEVVAIRKALGMLKPGGRVLVTLPYGVRHTGDGFINFDEKRVRAVIDASGAAVEHEEIWRWSNSRGWGRVDNAPDARYGYRGAMGAEACYLGVWCNKTEQ